MTGGKPDEHAQAQSYQASGVWSLGAEGPWILYRGEGEGALRLEVYRTKGDDPEWRWALDRQQFGTGYWALDLYWIRKDVGFCDAAGFVEALADALVQSAFLD